MAFMGFTVMARGLPAGLAAGDLFIGIRYAGSDNLYKVSSMGSTVLGLNARTSHPFRINDAPILSNIDGKRIDFSVNSYQVMEDDASFNFTIFNRTGEVAYSENRSVLITGLSLGGWSITSRTIERCNPNFFWTREIAGTIGFLH